MKTKQKIVKEVFEAFKIKEENDESYADVILDALERQEAETLKMIDELYEKDYEKDDYSNEARAFKEDLKAKLGGEEK